jgi:hypothetical protein
VLSGSGIAAPPYDTAEGAPVSVIGSASERWAGIVWRDWLIGLSFANLCYFRVWSAILTYTWSDTYVMKAVPGPAEIAACILNVLLAGTVVALLIAWARRRLRGRAALLAQWAGLAALVVPLQALRSVAMQHIPYFRREVLISLYGSEAVLAGVALAGGAATFAAIRWRARVGRMLASALLILSPFVALNVAQGLWKIARFDPAPLMDKPLAPMLPNAKTEPRIFWLIADEWDQRLTFLDRPGDLALPEIDRFRREALYATQAYPPSAHTSWSMPSLLIGKLVDGVKPTGPDELLLLMPDQQQPLRWSEQPNFFSHARQAGFNTALVGSYHPYGRVLHKDLTACWWWPTAVQANSTGDSFREFLINQPRSLLETNSRSVFGQALPVQQHARIYQMGLERAKEMAVNPEMGVVFWHAPIPHAPHPYDRRTGQFTLRSPVNGYYDSLALLDRTLGELRRALEARGLWETTTILLSSDHWNRGSHLLDGKKDHRVPFLLKLPGQKDGVVYDRPFNTVLSHDLLLAVLRGALRDPAALAAWLDAHDSSVNRRYNFKDTTFE